MKPIPYGRQFITDEDIAAVIETLKGDWLTQGPKVKEFEDAFASYIGSRYAVACANGTAALHLSAMALGVNAESRVICTPITFAASSNCIRYCGGEVVFSDIDPNTLLLDINKVEQLIEKHPKGYFSGVVPVDFGGYPVDLEQWRALADKHDLWILEDACHAPGGSFTDSKGTVQRCGNGNFADLAIFSFHPVKHIASGEGGMITTNDPELYAKLMTLRTHGIVRDPELMRENHGGWYHEMQFLGYNYRIPDVLCALGLSQLHQAGTNFERRQAIARRYDQAFAGTHIKTIPVPAGVIHGYHLYIIQIEDRKGLYDYLREQGIFAQVHYVPAHLHPYYQDLGWKKGDMPAAEAYYARCLSIPMYPSLTDEEQEYVIEKVLSFAS